MLVKKFMDPGWLSNSYVVADEPQGEAICIDTGGSAEEMLQYVEEHGFHVRKIFCTHHHHDHVAHNAELKEKWACEVGAHEKEAPLREEVDFTFSHDEVFEIGKLTVQVLHVPGHTAGQAAFLINGLAVFTGDTLFRGSVGGTCGPGHTTYEDLQHSIMEVFMKLPPPTKIYPGHTDDSTVAQEWETNPFIRLWRGLDSPEKEACEAFGQKGILHLEARDYDGGTKGLVEFEESGQSAIVPGSVIRKK